MHSWTVSCEVNLCVNPYATYYTYITYITYPIILILLNCKCISLEEKISFHGWYQNISLVGHYFIFVKDKVDIYIIVQLLKSKEKFGCLSFAWELLTIKNKI